MTTTLYDTAGEFDGFGSPSINAAGTVTFFAGLDAGPRGIFTGSGGPITTIADTSTFLALTGRPSINAAGTVAFSGIRTIGGDGIFTGSGGPITTIADTTGPLSDTFLFSPSINANDVVAFVAGLDAGGRGIFTGSGGPITTIADESGPFSGFGLPSINASGTVAFLAALDVGGVGIFTGPDPVADKVIRAGDPLFGSTVTGLSFSERGLNDAGQIAFRATLADGTSGIYRANPVVADLTLAKIDSPDPVNGSNLTYTMTVTNTGPDAATGVTLTDTLPAVVTSVSSSASQGSCSGTSRVTCALGTLANGASATVTIVVTPTVTGTLVNTAGVSSDAKDPDIDNNSARASTTVLALDTTPPATIATPSPTPNANGWNNTDVTVSLTATDNPGGSGVREISFSLSGAQSGAGLVMGSSTSVTISAEGITTLTYFARDNAGNQEASKTLTVRIDKTPPTGSVVINGGAAFTNTTGVTLTLSCLDVSASGCAEMQIAVDGAADTEPFVAFVSSTSATLLAGDGAKTVAVRFKDAAGNVSTEVIDDIVLDTTAPTVIISTPGTDSIITTSPVTVDVQASDAVGVASVSVNGVAASLITGTPQSGTWQATVPVTLPVPVGGALTFNATATDLATNPASATTVVDNDGIAAAIDTNPTAFSNDFNDTPLGGTTSGTITAGAGWTVTVVDIIPGGVQASISGTGTTATIDSCDTTGPERVSLNVAGETAAITCGSTGSMTVTAVAASPTIQLRKPPTGGPAQVVSLSTGQTATIGSPITASPANTQSILVELVYANDGVFGSFQLDAGEAVDVTFTPLGTVEVKILSGTVTLTIAGQTATLSSGQAQTFGTVAIDIKPGSFPNSINLGSGGVVPVAIFSSASFDARTVDPLTVTLASAPVRLKGKGTPMAAVEDVNGDGLLDLVVHVTTDALELNETDAQAVMVGQTFGGTRISGTDSVRVVP